MNVSQADASAGAASDESVDALTCLRVQIRKTGFDDYNPHTRKKQEANALYVGLCSTIESEVESHCLL